MASIEVGQYSKGADEAVQGYAGLQVTDSGALDERTVSAASIMCLLSEPRVKQALATATSISDKVEASLDEARAQSTASADLRLTMAARGATFNFESLSEQQRRLTAMKLTGVLSELKGKATALQALALSQSTDMPTLREKESALRELCDLAVNVAGLFTPGQSPSKMIELVNAAEERAESIAELLGVSKMRTVRGPPSQKSVRESARLAEKALHSDARAHTEAAHTFVLSSVRLRGADGVEIPESLSELWLEQAYESVTTCAPDDVQDNQCPDESAFSLFFGLVFLLLLSVIFAAVVNMVAVGAAAASQRAAEAVPASSVLDKLGSFVPVSVSDGAEYVRAKTMRAFYGAADKFLPLVDQLIPGSHAKQATLITIAILSVVAVLAVRSRRARRAEGKPTLTSKRFVELLEKQARAKIKETKRAQKAKKGRRLSLEF